MDQVNRIVVLIDMDCFYCQVEEKLNPELQGKPIAVVQYNPWKGGGIIAVNYVAREMGVTRHMRGDEAKEKCPEIQLPSVPCQRGKADITKYRDAGKDVAKVLQKFTTLLERASIDEAYLDITASVQERLKTLNINTVTTSMMPNTYALGYDSVEEFLADIHNDGGDYIDFDYEHAKQLLVGAVIVSEIRAAVFEETGYRCSAGISHNKILAKLVCGMNKPNKQTVLPKHCVNVLYKTLSIKKVKHLGGKFGDTVCELLKINKMAELQMFTEKELQTRFDEKNGTWLYNIAHGIDLEPVQARFNPKSIGCCKQFKGKSALVDLNSLRKWLKDLGDEIDDRLEKDALESNRTPKQMVVSYSVQLADLKDSSSSRSYNFAADDDLCAELFSNKALELLMEGAEGCKLKEDESNRRLKAPIKFLGISVGKFEDHSETKKTKKILDYFGAGSSKDMKEKRKEEPKETELNNPSDKKCKKNGKEYIMQKFFQVNDENSDCKSKIKSLTHNPQLQQATERSLDSPNSFFVKMLNEKSDKNNPTHDRNLNGRPATPVCDVMKCGDDSNDTEYSGSTINMEINKSMALFDEDPADVARISNIRQLLNSTIIKENIGAGQEDNLTNEDVAGAEVADTFKCSECEQIICIKMFEEHADYHLALKLRDEERREARKEKNKETIVRKISNEVKNKYSEEYNTKTETVSSVANFFTKVDDSIPTEVCAECGKKISLEKFAEHLDFHEVQKLSRELNKKPAALLSSTSSSVKRKRKASPPVKIKKMPNKSIDSFFR